MSLTDQQQKNIDLVIFILSRARFGKIDELKHCFTEDFVLHNAPGLPYGGDYYGWEGYVEQCKKLDEFWAEAIHHEREYIPAGDDRVIVHFWIDRDIAHNGKHVKLPFLSIWQFDNGKVKMIRPFCFDTKQVYDLANA